MIEGTMDRLEPESLAKLDEVCAFNRRERRWDGLILTGAEITLRKDIPDIARRARENGFTHVRLQTHGMRLADLEYCRELVDAGVDEYFVSITAPDAEKHDAITGVPGSFEKSMRGLQNLDTFEGVATNTNTVVTALSYRHLPEIVECLAHLRKLVQMDFWGYWPMSETDDKGLLVAHSDAIPYLRKAIVRAKQLGRAVEAKNFPECLLGDDADALENDQPKLLIDPSFWNEFHRNGFHQCAYRASCHSQRCLGLNTAYIKQFGWLHDPITPLPPAGNGLAMSHHP
jgi:MoaA/NifB/PqqE/SkfB family radical SAM enzyme